MTRGATREKYRYLTAREYIRVVEQWVGQAILSPAANADYARFRTFATTFLSCSIFFCRSMMA